MGSCRLAPALYVVGERLWRSPQVKSHSVMRHYVLLSRIRSAVVAAFVCVGLAPAMVAAAGEIEFLDVAPDLANVIGRLELLAEAKYPESEIAARVFRISDDGECDGSPASCPNSQIYVVVSTYDEAPDRRVFSLPSRRSWEFVRWSRLPKADVADSSVEFVLRYQEPRQDPTDGWWQPVEIEVSATPTAPPSLKSP